MIQIYDRNNRNYNMNGDFELQPKSCEYEYVLNGTCELTLVHPYDLVGRWKMLLNENIISAPTPHSDKQLFRIYDIEKTDTEITAFARPVFFDLRHNILVDRRPTNVTAQVALNQLLQGTGFTASTNLTTVSTAYYIRMNILEAIAGNEANSFVNRWGGERLYDNFHLICNDRLGGDYGARAEFGFNLSSIKEHISYEPIATRIIPVAFNGHMLEGPEPWVDSPNIGKYTIVYMKEIRFEDVRMEEDATDGQQGFRTLGELRRELVRRCEQLYEEGIDKPSVNYVIDLVDLEKTVEYKNYKGLVKIMIGDTVHCRHRGIDVEIEARAIRIKWDCVRKSNIEIELGNFTEDIINRMTNTNMSIDSITVNGGMSLDAERLAGFIDMSQTRLFAQRQVAQQSDVRAILFEDLVEDSPTFGAMALGTMGFQISSQRTPDGRGWVWTTAGTADGFIATYIVAGMLASRNWQHNTQGFMLNLDAGTINSRNMRLAANGILSINQAIIEGGRLTLFGDGRRAIEIFGTNIHFYAWSRNGEDVGTIAPTFSVAEDRPGLGVVAAQRSRAYLGYIDTNGWYQPTVSIIPEDGPVPPRIAGGTTGSVRLMSNASLNAQGGWNRIDYIRLHFRNGVFTHTTSESWSPQIASLSAGAEFFFSEILKINTISEIANPPDMPCDELMTTIIEPIEIMEAEEDKDGSFTNNTNISNQ